MVSYMKYCCMKGRHHSFYKFIRTCVTVRNDFCTQQTKAIPHNKLLAYLQNKIKATGPISIAEYMKEVLTNPHSGYYMHRDVFGSTGDFITSPEISQMFGELIAVWLYNEWSNLKKPTPLQLIEFGPGRGTLSADILRVFHKLKIEENFSLHLVEISQHLRKIQKRVLCDSKAELDVDSKKFNDHESLEISDEITMETKYGIPVSWHSDLSSVPNNFSLVLAHEFFDALPVHIFQRVKEKNKLCWKEVLIDVNETNSERPLRYVLSRNPTPASKIYIDPEEKRDHVEVSPSSALQMMSLSSRLEQYGGIALIVDYGYTNAEKCDTFRSFRKHKQHDPLIDPGTADLTVDVDFSYLIKFTKGKAVTVGPVSQGLFLKEIGIDVRLQKLLENASVEQKESLMSGYKMLMDPSEMGERFKFLAVYPAVLGDCIEKYNPPGFSSTS